MRRLRDLTRYRTAPVQEHAAELNRLQEVLETASIKLSAVATEVLGASGRRMVEAPLGGERDPPGRGALADPTEGGCAPGCRSCAGRWRGAPSRTTGAGSGASWRTSISWRWRWRSSCPRSSAARPRPPRRASCWAAGHDPRRGRRGCRRHRGRDRAWPRSGRARATSPRPRTSRRGPAWPRGDHLRGGKRLAAQAPKGNRWLRGCWGVVAWAVSHTKADCLAAQYHRLARRRGKDKAILAVAHSVLGIAHHVLRHRGPYADLGPDYFARFEAGRVVHHHVCKLRRLGRQVALAPTPAAPRRAA